MHADVKLILALNTRPISEGQHVMGSYTYPKFTYKSVADLLTHTPQHKPLVIVGAGARGLGCGALMPRLKGLDVLLLDEDDSVSFGSRAVCYAKRTLEILDRLGVGQPLCEKGVSWNIGRTYVEEEEVYQFNLVPEAGHKRPGMINLQQYYLEEALVNRALRAGCGCALELQGGRCEIRGKPSHGGAGFSRR
jgi:3-(3-hydroxy-phenyl)propionate hydroxylase